MLIKIFFFLNSFNTLDVAFSISFPFQAYICRKVEKTEKHTYVGLTLKIYLLNYLQHKGFYFVKS